MAKGKRKRTKLGTSSASVQVLEKNLKRYLKTKKLGQLKALNFNAAGIDVGAREHYVCIPEGRDEAGCVRKFGTTSKELHRLADWLLEHGITTVAMESTGMYWVPLFELLESKNLEVLLVHANHIAKVPGRKTDIVDSQWIQQLHTYGLLRGCFRPEKELLPLRSYMRQRVDWVRQASDHIRRMQKSLDQMNVQIHHAVSDLSGKTGMGIVEAIVRGETDPLVLAEYRNSNCKKSKKEIAEALAGNFQKHYIACLEQDLKMYKQCIERMRECDRFIEAELEILQGDSRECPPTEKKKKRRAVGNEPEFDLTTYLYRVAGCDLTKIEGIQILTALTIVSEVGPDLQHSFPTGKAFASWLGLCPGNKTTGGHNYSTRSRKVNHRLATALRIAASTVGRSDTPLGRFYRKKRAHQGPAKAITSTAHKMARIIYAMLTQRVEYDPNLVTESEEETKARRVEALKKSAEKMDMIVLTGEQLQEMFGPELPNDFRALIEKFQKAKAAS